MRMSVLSVLYLCMCIRVKNNVCVLHLFICVSVCAKVYINVRGLVCVCEYKLSVSEGYLGK